MGVLLDFADRLDVAQLGKAAARARYLLDRDAARRLARDEDEQQDARGSYPVEDPMTGMWHGELTLPPVEGAIVNTALEVLAKPERADDGPTSTQGRVAHPCWVTPGVMSRRDSCPFDVIKKGGVDHDECRWFWLVDGADAGSDRIAVDARHGRVAVRAA